MANYAEITDANTYFDTRLFTSIWDNASETDQIAALTMATQAIDNLNFLGELTEDDQENQFPRYEDDSVPTAIVNACCEIALSLIDGKDPEMEFENLTMSDFIYGEVKTKYNRRLLPEHIVAGIPSITAWRLLLPYIRDPRSIKMERLS